MNKVEEKAITCKYNNFGCSGVLLKEKILEHYNSCPYMNCEKVKEIRSGVMNVLMEIVIGDDECITPDFYENYLKNNSKYIRSLNFWWKNIKAKGAKFLCSKLEIFKDDLEELNLGNNEIADEGAVCLANVLKTTVFSNLRSLDISWNNISSKGLIHFDFRPLNKLTKLDLGWNNLGAEGAKILAENFSNLIELEELLLVFNDFKDKGVSELSKKLFNLKSLKKIDLGNNAISSSLKDFANGVKTLIKLEEIFLSKNSITSDLLVYLLSSTKDHIELQILDISANQITTLKGLRDISKCLEESKFVMSLSLNDYRIDRNKVLESGLLLDTRIII